MGHYLFKIIYILYICTQLVEQKNFEHDVTKTPFFAFAL